MHAGPSRVSERRTQHDSAYLMCSLQRSVLVSNTSGMRPFLVRCLQRTVLLELRKLYVRNLAGMVARRERLMAQIQVGFHVLQTAQLGSKAA